MPAARCVRSPIVEAATPAAVVHGPFLSVLLPRVALPRRPAGLSRSLRPSIQGVTPRLRKEAEKRLTAHPPALAPADAGLRARNPRPAARNDTWPDGRRRSTIWAATGWTRGDARPHHANRSVRTRGRMPPAPCVNAEARIASPAPRTAPTDHEGPVTHARRRLNANGFTALARNPGRAFQETFT